MGSHLTDQTLLDTLVKNLGCLPQETRFDAHGNLVLLALYGLDLEQLPDEIFQFRHLHTLNLSCNMFSSFPAEIGCLANLRKLYLNHNRLCSLPPEIGQLTKLEVLTLNHNCFTVLPPEIGQLLQLRRLALGNTGVSFMPEQIRNQAHWQKYTSHENQLCQLPQEIWKLKYLESLDLWANNFSTLPPEIGQLTHLTDLQLGRNQFPSLPSTIGQLTHLRRLLLHGHSISQVPPELGHLKKLEYLTLELASDKRCILPPEFWQLSALQHLDLFLGRIQQLPSEIGRLTQLKELFVGGQYLSSLPSEFWQLSQLQRLDIFRSSLSQLPSHIGFLTNLQQLRLHGNRLKQLPPEIKHLTNLQLLDLRNNRLQQLPRELADLTNLQELRVEGNPSLLTPPPEIVQQGMHNILAFLQNLKQGSITRYEAKLLVVGEGGTGKSSLLRALQGKPFQPSSATTHGIEVSQLELSFLDGRKKLVLNTWDFGGQHIYHATHQFFLTRRSLYLIVWNARLGVDQGRLSYWLETIKALAPGAPVLLVATHTDERIPDMYYQQLQQSYPQLAGYLEVSNKTGLGLDTLQEALIRQAHELPLVGQPWPEKWLEVEQGLQTWTEHHVSARVYRDYCLEKRIEESVAKGTLADYLHDLGKMLYFRDDYILRSIVVLKPNWITKAISLVLTDKEVSNANGILRHAELSRIWAVDEEGQPYEPSLYPIFLRLMERFDLSYQIEDDVPGTFSSSLIPQLLPYQPPIPLPFWPSTPPSGKTQLEMVYRFGFVPVGIMSWFIVRTHRYTQHVHWREGVLLAYQDHQARVELNPMQRALRLVVWGIQPHNFFTILMNTLDILLSRFHGLAVKREIPCICHWKQKRNGPCPHFYSYEELVRRMEARRHQVECAQTFTEVSVPTLLYGIHTSTDEQVMADIQQGQKNIEKRLDDLQKLDVVLEKLQQQSELLVRNFTRHWNLEMQRINAECPNTFLLTLGSTNHFHPKNWMSQEYLLYLVCQHPPGPHKIGDGYSLREAEEWWIKVSPWLNHLIKFLKFGIPMGKTIGAVYDAIDTEHLQTHLDLLEQIVQNIPETVVFDTLKAAVSEPSLNHEQQYIGPALRALYSFLTKVDPGCVWGGLHKTITPDGNILWLCEAHHKLYTTQPLSL